MGQAYRVTFKKTSDSERNIQGLLLQSSSICENDNTLRSSQLQLLRWCSLCASKAGSSCIPPPKSLTKRILWRSCTVMKALRTPYRILQPASEHARQCQLLLTALRLRTKHRFLLQSGVLLLVLWWWSLTKTNSAAQLKCVGRNP